jgi:hypothetical protein
MVRAKKKNSFREIISPPPRSRKSLTKRKFKEKLTPPNETKRKHSTKELKMRTTSRNKQQTSEIRCTRTSDINYHAQIEKK